MPPAIAKPIPPIAPAAAPPPRSARVTWLGRIFPLTPADLDRLERVARQDIPVEDLDPPLDPRIVRFLRGDDALDPALASFVRVAIPGGTSAPPHPEIVTALARLARAAGADSRPLRVRLVGPHGIGREQTAATVAESLGIPMLTVSLQRAPLDVPMGELGRMLFLDAWLRNALLYFTGLDELSSAGRALDAEAILTAIGADRGVTILAGEENSREPTIPGLISIPLGIPGAARRRALWAGALAVNALELPEVALGAVAERFRLTPVEIGQAAARARVQLDWSIARGEEGCMAEAVFSGARAQCGHELAALASKVEEGARWSDLILPEAVLAHLRELCERVAHGTRVLDDWGFGPRLRYGTSPTALFYGPSGVGKTMAASAIARALSLDLYRVNLSGIVSRYVGDTEKNLEIVFAAAERSNAVLLFDEADALFGKRSEVKEAHDRYANIEISYLLQRMELYQGIAILSTNLRGHLDEAFTRRLAFLVHFPLPDEAMRLALWRRIWPADAPVARDVDFEHLARAYPLSGGNIKNVVLAAAFAAASQAAPIGMRHLLHGIRREFGKLGKDLDPGELASAWHAAQGDG